MGKVINKNPASAQAGLYSGTLHTQFVSSRAYRNIEGLSDELLEMCWRWARAKTRYNRLHGVFKPFTVEDYHHEIILAVLELREANLVVSHTDMLLYAEAKRRANRMLDRRGYRSGADGKQNAPYAPPVDPQVIWESEADSSGTRHQDWACFQADAKRILMGVEPVLWYIFQWFLKNHPVSRAEYLKEYKRRQRLPEAWKTELDATDTPAIPGYTVDELAKKFGIHRNTVANYRKKIKNLLQNSLGKDYSFLSDVLYIVEMA